jgi:membrane protease YdiL (CAAX protease family)
VAAAVLLRGLFHLYYGPGALAVVVWIPVSLIVFWWGRSLFPVIVAHILWDVRGDLGWYTKSTDATAVYLYALVALLVLAATAQRSAQRHRREDPTCAPCSD